MIAYWDRGLEWMGEGLQLAVCPSFTGPTSLAALDVSGNANHGTLTNMDRNTAWATSGGKGALSFAPNNTNRVEVVDNRFLNAVSQFSFSAWFNLRAYTGSSFGNAIFCRGQIGTFTNDINLLIQTNGVMLAQVNNGVDGSATFNLPSFYALNTWASVAFIYNGNGTTNDDRLKIYLNGANLTLSYEYTVPSITSTVTSNVTFRLGQYLDSLNATSVALNGFLDDIRLYNRAFTPSEIRQMYELGRGGGMLYQPPKRRSVFIAAGFKAYWHRRQSQLIGGGV